MAFMAPYLTDEEKRKAAEGTQRSTSGVVDSTVNASSNTGSPTASTEASTPGTGFVNLQQYLDMNQGEGARLAGEANKDLINQTEGFKQDSANLVQNSQGSFEKATGADTASKVASGLASDASATYKAAKDFLGAGYKGPTAADLTSELAVNQKELVDNLSSVDDSGVINSKLQSTYGKSGPYTAGFGLLDSFLVGGTDSGKAKLSEIKNEANAVQDTFEDTTSQLSEAEKQAQDALAANKQKVIEAAKATKGSTVKEADSKISELNNSISNKVGASQASYGDVLSEDKAKDLEALDAILKESGNWWDKSFNAGKDKPVDEPSTPGSGGGGNGDDGIIPLDTTAKTLGAAAKAGADISDAFKKINEPNQEMFNALGEFRQNAKPETALELLKKAGLAPFVTAYNSVQVANELVNQLDARITKELDKKFPGVGAGLGTALKASRGPGVLPPKLKNFNEAAKSAQSSLTKKTLPKPIVPDVPSWTKGVAIKDPSKYFSGGQPKPGAIVSLVNELSPKNMVELLKSAPNELGKEIKAAISSKAAGMELGLLNQLNRAMDKAGIGGSPKKAVASALKAIKTKSDAHKAAGAEWAKQTAAAQKALTDAANKAAEEAKKLGGNVSQAGKDAIKYVSKRIPKLRF